MNAIKKLVILFAICIIQNTMFSQTLDNKVLSLSSIADSLSLQGETYKKPNKILSDVEVKLTPEQQGFTKYMINEKVFYYKQEGSLKTEYTPNN
jgi:hypothetical protein